MDEQAADWRTAVLELYRLAWSELQRHWSGLQPAETEFYVEELKEALLDLKEATLAMDQRRALAHVDEVQTLLTELRSRM